MSAATYYFILLLMSGVLLWQLKSGEALGAWWQGRIFRVDSPKTYWFVLGVQCAILIAFVVSGRSWNIR